ncbi:DUF5615 family PIN-like protein [Patescibacteria group bacterium]|nr:DUF5615 family PIN-like protein [Patescibacteria group bacterium]MCG2701878.1 DUF5615 family PIN-like protein [Candidatus Parcubacteria bacterium]MBU4264447.1 DUF5615 family PIN-like protein [Patescibacteria group bacterium]MBU4390211.1 DUF5615 family PIN-like protein [Patescibacteria group bacterium]MBU4397213.1 DUF5615 family PIN-like protein [Patescibacteria group bacterium]
MKARILVDQCVNIDVVDALRLGGYSVVRVSEIGMGMAADEKIFKFAEKNKMVLLTFDRGFGIFCLGNKKHGGVVIVLIDGLNRSEIADKVLKFFKGKTGGDLKGGLYVVGKKIRARRG